MKRNTMHSSIARILLALTALVLMVFAFGCEDTTDPNTVATPTFSVAEGTYDTAQVVALSCATSGATIYYTLDGTAPNNTSTQYVDPIAVNTTTTIKAIAYKGENTSAIATANYTIRLSFTDWATYYNYMGARDWGILVHKLMADANNLYLGFDFTEWYPDDVTTNDTFMLMVDQTAVPVYVQDNKVYTIADYITVPLTTTQIHVVFKRNADTEFSGTVTLPADPANITCPESPLLSQPITVAWTVGDNYSMQVCSMEVYNDDGDYDWYDGITAPTDRSYDFPANAMFVADPSDGTASVYEGMLAEYGNSVVLASTVANKDLYGLAKNLKTRTHNPFGRNVK